jgi:hypothetical protein
MKVEDAVASAMDWLAQLREEGHDEPPHDAGDVPPPVAAPQTTATPPAAAVSPLPAPPAAAIPPAAAMPPAVPPPTEPDGAGYWFAPTVTPPPVAPPPTAAMPPAVTALQVVPPPAAAMPPAVAVPPPADGTSRRTGMRSRVEITERAAIGDELRIPIAWCEMGSCISHYADPGALGEADIRARAIAAGWRLDALSRLACPQCQQSDAWFWTAHPVALWDRDTAVAMTTLMAEAVRESATADATPAADTPAGLRTEPALAPLPVLPVRGRHRQPPDRVTGEGSRGNDQTG